MDILRNLFGNVTSGIIRLAVAVGVLAAVYLFIVKPVMDTTENVSKTINDTSNRAFETANRSFERAFGPHSQAQRALRQAKRQVHHAAPHSNADKLLRCVQAAAGNVDRMQRCTVRYPP
jgi:F0F1-type ATP synthase membrane subunit b/b'